MRNFYVRALFVSLLGPYAVHAQNIDENSSAAFTLRSAEFLGEAAAQSALQAPASIATQPTSDGETSSATIKGSETINSVQLGSEPQPTSQNPLVSISSSDSPPPPPLPLQFQITDKKEPVEIKPSKVRTPVPMPVADETDSDSGTKIGLAPIRWGGDVSEALRWTRLSSGTAPSTGFTLDNMQQLNLRASSYLWQPWLAQVDGGIGLMHDNASTDSITSSSNSITGNGAVSIFSRSRFPFTASFAVSDSRTDANLTSSDYKSKRFGLQQIYKTVSGESTFAANFDHSIFTSSAFGDDTVTTSRGTYAARFGASQSVDLNAFHTQTSQPGINSGLNLNGITARHGYRPDSLLTIDTNASLTNSVLNTQTNGVPNTNTSRYLQASTNANWRPDEEKPLFFFAGARLFNSLSEFASVPSTTQSLGGNAGLTYNLTRNLALGASGNVTRTTTAGTSNVATLETANATYNGDVINYKKIAYNWSAGTNINNETNTLSENHQRATVFGFHSLFYTPLVSDTSSLNISATQAVSSNYDPSFGVNNTISHNASIAWSGNQSATLSGTTTASLGDSHTFGYSETNNQFASWQLNGRKQFSLNSSLNANTGLNWTRQGMTGQTSTNANASIAFQHMRAFNVRGLRYTMSGTVATTAYNERLLGNVDAQRTQSGYSLIQALTYRLGRLDTSLTATVSNYDGRENASIYMRIGRNFGNM
jgi:hypothetical protein